MLDYTGTFREFSRFVGEVNAQGRTPSEADIDLFLENFLSQQYGFLYPGPGGTYIYSGLYSSKETGEKTLDSKGASYGELEAEIKPLLVAKVKEVYSVLGETQEFDWDPAPISISKKAMHFAREMGIDKTQWNKMSGTERGGHEAMVKAEKYISQVKSRIKVYNETVLPFMLRKTMYHPLTAILYSTREGESWEVRNAEGKFFSIDDEKELQSYLRSKTVKGFPAAQDEALRSIWFQPSPQGDKIKMAVIDIDNPAGLPDKTVRKAVRFVAETLEKNNYPYIIMFTGGDYQVWFSKNPLQDLGSLQDARSLVESLMYDPELFHMGTRRKEAVDKKLIWLDPSTFKAHNPIRMFFSLHYPTSKSKKVFSGLVALPVGLGDIETFDPITNAHPEEVLKHFDRYASIVSQFFDTALIGQDYDQAGDIEAAPPCIRLENKDPDHSLLSHLVENEGAITVVSENIEAMLEDEEKVVCFIKERGVSAVLHYNSSGKIRVGGKTLSSKTLGIKGGASVKVKSIKAVLITSNGTAIYDDYLCRDIERYCEAADISKLTLVGSVVKLDDLGNNMGAQGVRSILERKESPLPMECKMLTFAPYKLIEYNESVKGTPLGKQLEELSKIRTSRINPTPYWSIESPVGSALKRRFRDLLLQRKVGSLIVQGEETYVILSRRTISVAVVGIDKQSVLYTSESKSIPPVYVAVAKKHSKFGLMYLIIGKAQVNLKKEDRERLKELVRGEEGEYEDREGNLVKTYANIIPLKARVDEFADDVEILEPSIVVDVQYDDISPQMTPAMMHHYRSTSRGTNYRAIPKTQWITPLIEARVISIREDLDHNRLTDIGIDQDPLFRVTASKPPKGLSIINSLPNPRRERVKRNGAFFGVPTSRKIWLDGQWDPDWFDAETMTHGSVRGGRLTPVNLYEPGSKGITGEFQKAYQRSRSGKPGFKVFVDPDSKVKSGVASTYFAITGLGSMFQDAVDDPYGVGGPFGASVVSMNDKVKPMPYKEQLASIHTSNKVQNIEDTKIVGNQIGKIPTSRDPLVRGGEVEDQIPGYRKDDESYTEKTKGLDEALNKALSPNKITETQFKAALIANNVIENPVVKMDAWESRVNVYATEYEKWKESDEPKEPWETKSQGLFNSWELPILEKERRLREATGLYALTPTEVDVVNSRFGTPMSGASLESVLSDLYGAEGEEDEIIPTEVTIVGEEPIAIEEEGATKEKVGGVFPLLKEAHEINKEAKEADAKGETEKKKELYKKKEELMDQAMQLDPTGFVLNDKDPRLPGVKHIGHNFQIHVPMSLVKKHNIKWGR